ncbi:hypothetical protein JCM24511_02010 [Saitozyma sp. JCM 24511]|nr:hypothetical protein JCM24511_02010 [Saitozyma sp. JCM 24511]
MAFYSDNNGAPFTGKHGLMDRDFAPATAVIVPNSARTVYISGIVGDNEDGSFGDFRTQCFLVFEKIAKVLQAAHPDFKSAQEAWASVFEVTAYHVGSLPDHLPIELEAANKYLAGAHPTWTSAGVSNLFHEGQSYEIHVKAALP